MDAANTIKTILVVEDDRFIGEMYVRSLQRSGYTVDWVTSGNDGIEAATQRQYDLLLLDVMLPEKQGDEVLRQLRTEGEDKIPHSRIIVLTNFDQDDESRAAMQAKADGYLIKADITPKKLLEIIADMPKREG
ncbi:response regulator [Candidatus Saccharibacteria bacterium]|nr:MAG: response regulator [Candidatus Saccharibacteria bacterium]